MGATWCHCSVSLPRAQPYRSTVLGYTAQTRKAASMPISSATARFPRAPSIAACAAVFLGLTFSGLALALEWNLQPAASRIAAEIQDLHEYGMFLCTAIFAGVFGVM